MIVFHNIVVMLATSSSGERSFSRVKTYLMGQSKFNHLTLLNTKNCLTIWTCIGCYEFVQANDCRVQRPQLNHVHLCEIQEKNAIDVSRSETGAL